MGHKFPPGHPQSAASAFAPHQPELGVVADDVDDAPEGALTASEANARLLAGKTVSAPAEVDPEPEAEAEESESEQQDPDDTAADRPAAQKATRSHRAHKAAAKGKS